MQESNPPAPTRSAIVIGRWKWRVLVALLFLEAAFCAFASFAVILFGIGWLGIIGAAIVAIAAGSIWNGKFYAPKTTACFWFSAGLGNHWVQAFSCCSPNAA